MDELVELMANKLSRSQFFRRQMLDALALVPVSIVERDGPGEFASDKQKAEIASHVNDFCITIAGLMAKFFVTQHILDHDCGSVDKNIDATLDSIKQQIKKDIRSCLELAGASELDPYAEVSHNQKVAEEILEEIRNGHK